MTGEEVCELLPRLRLLALKIKNRNGVEVEELVQVAVLAILDPKSKFTNPLVLAYSRMRDYRRLHGLRRFGRGRRKWERVFPTDSDWGNFQAGGVEAGVVFWDQLPLEPDERVYLQRVCEGGWTRAEAARAAGWEWATESEFEARLLRLRRALRRRWERQEEKTQGK